MQCMRRREASEIERQERRRHERERYGMRRYEKRQEEEMEKREPEAREEGEVHMSKSEVAEHFLPLPPRRQAREIEKRRVRGEKCCLRPAGDNGTGRPRGRGIRPSGRT